MGRAALHARLHLAFDPLLNYAGLDALGVIALFDQAVDDAYAALGVPPTPDPALTPAQSRDLPYLVDYYALLVLVRRMAAQVYHHTPEATYNWQELYTQAHTLLGEAAAQITARGYGIRRGAVVGTITAVTPLPDPGLGVSADDVALTGNPYYPYPGGPPDLPLLASEHTA